MHAGKKLDNNASPDEQLDRIEMIAKRIVDFCKQRNAEAVYVEEYAFAQGRSRAHALGELGGEVKRQARRRLGFAVQPIVASQARKTLLMKVPRAKSKVFVIRNVQRLGGQTKYWTDDEIDAFVIANHGLMLRGGVAMGFDGE